MATPEILDVQQTDCCIVGGGPAGAVLADRPKPDRCPSFGHHRYRFQITLVNAFTLVPLSPTTFNRFGGISGSRSVLIAKSINRLDLHVALATTTPLLYHIATRLRLDVDMY